MDLNTFKSKYYQAMHVREKVKKEAHALSILKDVMVKCEPNQIDNLFMLSVIMKEEQALLEQVATFNQIDSDILFEKYRSTDDVEELQKMVNTYGEDTPKNRIQSLNAVKALINIKQRKEVLEGAIKDNELVKMLEQIPVTKIQILNGEQVDDI